MGGTKKTTTASGTANSGKSSQKAGGTSMKSAKRKVRKMTAALPCIILVS